MFGKAKSTNERINKLVVISYLSGYELFNVNLDTRFSHNTFNYILFLSVFPFMFHGSFEKEKILYCLLLEDVQ